MTRVGMAISPFIECRTHHDAGGGAFRPLLNAALIMTRVEWPLNSNASQRHCEPSQTARQSMLFDPCIRYKKTTGSFLPVADRFA